MLLHSTVFSVADSPNCCSGSYSPPDACPPPSSVAFYSLHRRGETGPKQACPEQISAKPRRVHRQSALSTSPYSSYLKSPKKEDKVIKTTTLNSLGTRESCDTVLWMSGVRHNQVARMLEVSWTFLRFTTIIRVFQVAEVLLVVRTLRNTGKFYVFD